MDNLKHNPARTLEYCKFEGCERLNSVVGQNSEQSARDDSVVCLAFHSFAHMNLGSHVISTYTFTVTWGLTVEEEDGAEEGEEEKEKKRRKKGKRKKDKSKKNNLK